MPHTASGRGRIIYERDNRMAAFLMHPDWLTTDIDRGFTAYSGPFKVVDGHVHHRVDFSSQRSMVGQDLIRKVTFEDGVLFLEAAAADGAARHVLEWRRTKG
jgi:hypothetical protein